MCVEGGRVKRWGQGWRKEANHGRQWGHRARGEAGARRARGKGLTPLEGRGQATTASRHGCRLSLAELGALSAAGGERARGVPLCQWQRHFRTLRAPSCPSLPTYPPPCVPACPLHARTRTPPHLVPSRPPVDVMASPALRRLAMEAKKPRPCEGVRVLGPVSETTPLKYSIEIVGP